MNGIAWCPYATQINVGRTCHHWHFFPRTRVFLFPPRDIAESVYRPKEHSLKSMTTSNDALACLSSILMSMVQQQRRRCKNAGDCTKAPNLLKEKEQKYMDPIILNLGIHFLSAVDAFSASCVSQEWHHFLSAEQENGDFWKQICLNSGRSGILGLENSADYCRLAMRLCLRDNKERRPAPQKNAFDSHVLKTTLRFSTFTKITKKRMAWHARKQLHLLSLLSIGMVFQTAMAIIWNVGTDFARRKSEFGQYERLGRTSRAWRQEVSSNHIRYWGLTPLAYTAHLASTRLGNAPHLQVHMTLLLRDNAEAIYLSPPWCPTCQFVGWQWSVHTNTYLTGNDKGMIARALFDGDSIIVQCSMIKFASKVHASPWLRWRVTVACKVLPGIWWTMCLWTQC